MVDAVQRLRRIAALAASGEALGADGPWLARILDKLLSIDPECMDVTFEEQVPLRPGWKKVYARAQQRRGIRALTAQLHPHGNTAHKIEKLWSRFGTYRLRWRLFDHRVNPHAADSQEFWLFEIFQAGAALNCGNQRDIVPGRVQLRRIIEAPEEPSC